MGIHSGHAMGIFMGMRLGFNRVLVGGGSGDGWRLTVVQRMGGRVVFSCGDDNKPARAPTLRHTTNTHRPHTHTAPPIYHAFHASFKPPQHIIPPPTHTSYKPPPTHRPTHPPPHTPRPFGHASTPPFTPPRHIITRPPTHLTSYQQTTHIQKC